MNWNGEAVVERVENGEVELFVLFGSLFGPPGESRDGFATIPLTLFPPGSSVERGKIFRVAVDETLLVRAVAELDQH